jgi:hypothetical protein
LDHPASECVANWKKQISSAEHLAICSAAALAHIPAKIRAAKSHHQLAGEGAQPPEAQCFSGILAEGAVADVVGSDRKKRSRSPELVEAERSPPKEQWVQSPEENVPVWTTMRANELDRLVPASILPELGRRIVGPLQQTEAIDVRVCRYSPLCLVGVYVDLVTLLDQTSDLV